MGKLNSSNKKLNHSSTPADGRGIINELMSNKHKSVSRTERRSGKKMPISYTDKFFSKK